MQLVTIPAGKFKMGSTKKEVEKQISNSPNVDKRLFERQLEQHEVYLAEYKISKYHITNKQFAKFVEDKNYITTAQNKGWGFHFEDGKMKKVEGAFWEKQHGIKDDIKNKSSHPVVMVSWYDALEYCKWLSKIEGKNYSLPSEAQWEKAARGTNGLLWPWGNEWDSDLCNCENKLRNTTEVGKYSPSGDSPFGCCDMAGNVLEWTTTTIGTRKPWPSKFVYPYNDSDRRENLTGDNRRVARGGTYQRGADMCRCAFRFADEPENRYSSLGFRVVSI